MTDAAWDVVVVGAGAAGLLAACRAAERGRRTLLLEKNRRPGAKILMSGGTRCNITQATDVRGIVRAFGKQGQFLHSALAALGPPELVALFEAEGVLTKIEDTGKVFPQSDKATDVLAALVRRLERSGCQLALNEPVQQLVRGEAGFEIATPLHTHRAESVIVTTGGLSYPGCGTTGDGYPWLAALGHTIVPTRPALTPVTTNATWVAALRGVTLPDVAVRVEPADAAVSDDAAADRPKRKRQPLAEARGGFLFTHFGLSGPAVLDVSRAITGHALGVPGATPQSQQLETSGALPQAPTQQSRPVDLLLECDFLPDTKADALDALLRSSGAESGKKHVAGVVGQLLPRRLVDSLLETLELPDVQMAQLKSDDRRRLIGAIKQCRVPISGTRGFKKAEVTAGGVALSEVDSSTMQSKRVENLYLAGEILDLDGPIGGYNFQAAFSTAWLAGGHA
ncbi:MAG: NAD(P)/FAD-dependent oxidoreductase [Planctomycetia bacterium]|nr:NAD(P)/FAD-dependent oxidoreductase [Planctomycetia bacterium]